MAAIEIRHADDQCVRVVVDQHLREFNIAVGRDRRAGSSDERTDCYEHTSNVSGYRHHEFNSRI
jgi:hypothetical protein